MSDPRRALPSVGALLEHDAMRALLARAPRAMVADAVRTAIDEARRSPAPAPASIDEWVHLVDATLSAREQPSLRRVLNATGVVLHTNLGRAPLAAVALDAIRTTAEGYANVEYDLETGERGSRYVHCVSLLRELTGADDALVVNNGAAALVLALDTFSRGREAIVSRGELVEIGGSFRIPDIMTKSGAQLVEVGTTNRTHVDDYRHAVSERTGAIVKVHRSNFALEGFVAEASIEELAPIAHERGVPLLHDLGSGLMISLEGIGLRGEPTAADALRAGASVVTMSGDKLLGGPQAGIVLGNTDVVARMKKNPLTRALRVDKLTLAALEATLALYREPERALRDVPVLRMLALTPAALEARANAFARTLRDALPADARTRVSVMPSEGSVGGGAFPTAKLAGFAVALSGDANAIERALRTHATPVIARIADGRVLLDLRTIAASEESILRDAVLTALQ